MIAKPIIGTNAPIGLKSEVRAGFSHKVPHVKLQPLRLKDGNDIARCIQNISYACGMPRSIYFWGLVVFATRGEKNRTEKN